MIIEVIIGRSYAIFIDGVTTQQRWSAGESDDNTLTTNEMDGTPLNVGRWRLTSIGDLPAVQQSAREAGRIPRIAAGETGRCEVLLSALLVACECRASGFAILKLGGAWNAGGAKFSGSREPQAPRPTAFYPPRYDESHRHLSIPVALVSRSVAATKVTESRRRTPGILARAI